MAPGLGVPVINGEDCAAGEDELLHATRIRTMARTGAFICRLNAGLECRLRLRQGTQVNLATAGRCRLQKAGRSAIRAQLRYPAPYPPDCEFDWMDNRGRDIDRFLVGWHHR